MNKLSKEAKIGLGVLAILALVFVVVLVGRLIGSGGDKVVATEEQFKPVAPPKAAAHESPNHGKPTVLAPRNQPGQRPKVAPADVGRLTAANDDGVAKPSAALVKTPTPSLMPDPPPAQAADPRDRYGSAYAGTTPPTYEQGGVETAEAVAGTPTTDPFRGRAMQYPTATEKTAQPYNTLRVPDQADPPPATVIRGSTPLPSPNYGRETRPTHPPANTESGRAYAGDNRVVTGSQYQSARPAPQYGSAYSDSSAGVESRPASSPRTATRDGRRDDGTYEVQPNDNYWLISEKLYGTGAYFKALAEHNRRKSARDGQLQVGDVLVTPDVAQLEKGYPDLCPKPSRREAVKRQMTTVSARIAAGGRTYVTQEGDTLFDIARTELGKASRWAEIYDLNRDLLGSDYNYLRPGLQLALPEGEAAADPGKVTRRVEPEGTFRR